MTMLVTCRFGVPALGPAPEKPKPNPGMSWAEMARREGHRKGLPPKPTQNESRIDTMADQVAGFIAARGPCSRHDIRTATGINHCTLETALHRLIAAGRVHSRVVLRPRGNGNMVLLSVPATPAGVAKAGEGR